MQPTTNKIDDDTLNKATEELLVCLPGHASELMHELAIDSQAPIWQIMCGVILETYMQGMLSNYTLDPAWMEGIKQYSYICKHCNEPFTPVNIGQLYCCNDCGTAAISPTKQPKKSIVKEPTDEPVARSSKSTKPSSPTAPSVEPTSDDSLAARIAKFGKTPRQDTGAAGWSSDNVPLE